MFFPIFHNVYSGPYSLQIFLSFLFAYHTSHSESLDVTERMDVAMSARSVTLETLVVGLAAVHGDSAELCGVHSDRERIPFCPMAWCWSLDGKRERIRSHMNMKHFFTFIN